MAAQSVVLLDAAAATGSQKSYVGGRTAIVSVVNTLNGATVKVQMLLPDGVSLADVATITASGYTVTDLPTGSYQVTITGGPPTAITVHLIPISYFR